MTREPIPADALPPRQHRERLPPYEILEELEADVRAALLPPGEILVDVEADSRDLADVCDQIGDRASAYVLVDPRVGVRVSCRLRRLPWRDAVGALARLTGCEVQVRGDRILLLTRPPPFRLQAEACPAPALLRLLGAYAGYGLVVGPAALAAGGGALTISAELADVEYRHALEVVALAVGWTVEEGAGATFTVEQAPWARGWTASDTDGSASPPSDREGQLDAHLAALTRQARAGRREAAQETLAAVLALTADPPSAADSAGAAAAERRVTAALVETERLVGAQGAMRPALDAFARYWDELDAYLRADADVARRRGAIEGWDELVVTITIVRRLALPLERIMGLAEVHLREMVAALRAERYAEVLAGYDRLRDLVRAAITDAPEAQARLWAAVSDGYGLAEHARDMAALAAFTLDLTAVAICHESGSGVVANGAVVAPGELLPGHDGEPIEELILIEVVEGGARLRYRTREVVLELGR